MSLETTACSSVPVVSARTPASLRTNDDPPPLAVRPLDAPWRRLELFDALESTQQLASRRAAAGEDLRGVAIQALSQDRGRGRMNRLWISPPGGLYVTVGLPEAITISVRSAASLTLLAALACARTLRDQLGLQAALKWPNDLVLFGRKVAGVLGELAPAPASAAHGNGRAAGPTALLGLGLNWCNNVDAVALAGGPPAASLAEFRPGLAESAREAFLLGWLDHLGAAAARLLADPDAESEELTRQAEPILWRRGEWVRLERTEAGTVEGQLLGLAPRGAARVRLESGREIEVHCGGMGE